MVYLRKRVRLQTGMLLPIFFVLMLIALSLTQAAASLSYIKQDLYLKRSVL